MAAVPTALTPALAGDARLDASPLVAAAAWLDAPALVEGDRSWTWRQVHEASIALAERLAGASVVCNLCGSRLGFLVVFLAALRSRCLLILPPSGGSADLAAVMKAAERPIVVGDADAWPEPWCADRYMPHRSQWQAATASDDALAWRPDWDATALLLYTSGSTGVPQAQAKTLRQLALGAVALGARLAEALDGGMAAAGRIVSSVPPQHMFGLECAVMLPLVHGSAVVEGRPLLPADVRDACAGAPERTAWIATPLHLRSLVHSGEPVGPLAVVIVSTMPLTQAIAAGAEPLVGAPVLEIYGSTETGALAMRRTAAQGPWRCLDRVELRPGDGETLARGAHFASPARLLDELTLHGDGSFALVGRRGDLVKIGGRRASLAGLDLLLQELPALEDGVFYLPETGHPTERLCLIYAGPPLDRAATRRWLRERVDPVFLPRTFIRVDRLPRGENGKLHRPALDRLYARWQSQDQAQPPRSHAAAAKGRALRS